MRLTCLFLLAPGVFLLTTTGSHAQVLVSNSITGTNPSASNPYTAGQTVGLHLSTSGIGRGAGLAPASASDRFSASGWNSPSLDTGDYFTWTLTPASGYQLNLTNLTFTGQASSTGPTNFSLRSSLDGFSTSLGTVSATGASITLTSSSFQGVSGSVEFRLYGWGASGSTGTFSVNDYTFTGTLSAVPEPSTYAAMAGLAGFGVTALRRHRARKRAAEAEEKG